MKETKKAAGKAAIQEHSKDNNFYLFWKRVYKVLLSGGSYSTVQLMQLTGSSDPRGIIRRLRNEGVPIYDYWEDDGLSRHKMYFIHRMGGDDLEPKQIVETMEDLFGSVNKKK